MSDNPRRKQSEIIELLFCNRKIDELSEYLLENPELDLVGLKDSQANTVLHQLAFEGHLDIMQLFVMEAKKRLQGQQRRRLY
jgi:ankyrin repeat protein